MARREAFGGCRRTPACRLRPRLARNTVKVSAMMCPYRTLGLPSNAEEADVKKAYRRLALQYHPDVNMGCMEAERKFLSIQQAYELLTGRGRGGAGGPGAGGESHQANGWEFHDWYWSFMQQRRWSSQHSAKPPPGATAAGFKEPEHASTLRSQLAGLRQRAAVRAVRRDNSQAEGCAAEAAAAAGEGAGEQGLGGRERPAAWAAGQQPTQQQQQQGPAAGPELVYDTTEMSDGVNFASGFDDPASAAAAAAAAAARQRRFVATEGHKERVMGQLGGLRRRSAMRDGPAAADPWHSPEQHAQAHGGQQQQHGWQGQHQHQQQHWADEEELWAEVA